MAANEPPVPGWAECDGCVDVRIQREHCGACGIVCPQNAVCDAGECRCSGGWEGPNATSAPPILPVIPATDVPTILLALNARPANLDFRGGCSEESALDYQDYVRQPGVALPRNPTQCPCPPKRADQPNQVIYGDVHTGADCTILHDTCVTVHDGAQVSCAGAWRWRASF